MKHLTRVALLAAESLAGLSAWAQASDARVIVTMGGEAYDGPPKFTVSFDGRPIGGGVVDKAIDTAAKGRFADAADKVPYIESFDFAIPDADFKPGGAIRITFTNEAYGGEGSNRDRNLFISTVTLNGETVKADAMTTVTPKGIRSNTLVGDYLEIRDGNEDAVINAPEGGWPDAAVANVAPAAQPAPSGVTADATGTVEPAAPATPAETAPQPGAQIASATAAPAEEPPIPAPPKSVAIGSADHVSPEAPGATPNSKADAALAESQNKPIVEKASAKSDMSSGATVGGDTCGRTVLYNVLGFNENSNDLTPRLTARLDQIVRDIGSARCTVMVTGYASERGGNATNALFAIERAQNVLGYLKARGVQFVKAQASGVGATTKFGPAPYANRRVVVSVSP